MNPQNKSALLLILFAALFINIVTADPRDSSIEEHCIENLQAINHNFQKEITHNDNVTNINTAYFLLSSYFHLEVCNKLPHNSLYEKCKQGLEKLNYSIQNDLVVKEFLESNILKKLYIRIQHSTGFLHRDSETIRDFILHKDIVIPRDEKMDKIAPFAMMWNEVHETCQFKKHIFSQRPEKYVEEGKELTDFNPRKKVNDSDTDIELEDMNMNRF